MSALIVESLHSRLARLVPGARVEPTPSVRTIEPELGATVMAAPPPTERYRVVRGGVTLATASSEREAIARALFLWGAR